MIWELDGVAVGHWSDPVARTGCTAVLFHPAAVASGEVRGSAPASHEMALLDPTATVERIDAVVLTGGSAFGLASTAGAVRWCEEAGRGVPTLGGRVPIVVGLALFDLTVGDPSVRPGPDEGHAACEAAAAPGSGTAALGRVGAGCGATVGKWRGEGRSLDGGLVGAVQRDGELIVAALVAVNAWGDVAGVGLDGEPWPTAVAAGIGSAGPDGPDAATNTTIGVVVTNARLDKTACQHVARGAHDGLARAVTPPHSHLDGDAFVAVATGAVDAPAWLVRAHAVTVVDRAIRSLAAEG